MYKGWKYMLTLVALDMDGTLLNDERKISLFNERVIKKLKSKGTKIVLASGRPYNGLKPYLKQLDLINEDDYSITYNGALIINNKTQEIIFKKILNQDIVFQALELAKKLNIGFFAYNNQSQILTENITEYVKFEQELTHNELLTINFKEVKNEYYKITFTASKEDLDQYYSLIEKQFNQDYTVISSHDFFIEIINKKASKGQALDFLLDYLKLERQNIAAFGDNENDYSMLTVANHKFVMNNSTSDKLKDIAEEIVPNNFDDGVGLTLQKYL